MLDCIVAYVLRFLRIKLQPPPASPLNILVKDFSLTLRDSTKHDHGSWLSLPTNELGSEILKQVRPKIYASI